MPLLPDAVKSLACLRLRSAGLTQEGQKEEELRAALEHVKATAAPLPQRLTELRYVVERETQELRRREAGMPRLC